MSSVRVNTQRDSSRLSQPSGQRPNVATRSTTARETTAASPRKLESSLQTQGKRNDLGIKGGSPSSSRTTLSSPSRSRLQVPNQTPSQTQVKSSPLSALPRNVLVKPVAPSRSASPPKAAFGNERATAPVPHNGGSSEAGVRSKVFSPRSGSNLDSRNTASRQAPTSLTRTPQLKQDTTRSKLISPSRTSSVSNVMQNSPQRQPTKRADSNLARNNIPSVRNSPASSRLTNTSTTNLTSKSRISSASSSQQTPSPSRSRKSSAESVDTATPGYAFGASLSTPAAGAYVDPATLARRQFNLTSTQPIVEARANIPRIDTMSSRGVSTLQQPELSSSQKDESPSKQTTLASAALSLLNEAMDKEAGDKVSKNNDVVYEEGVSFAQRLWTCRCSLELKEHLSIEPASEELKGSQRDYTQLYSNTKKVVWSGLEDFLSSFPTDEWLASNFYEMIAKEGNFKFSTENMRSAAIKLLAKVYSSIMNDDEAQTTDTISQLFQCITKVEPVTSAETSPDKSPNQSEDKGTEISEENQVMKKRKEQSSANSDNQIIAKSDEEGALLRLNDNRAKPDEENNNSIEILSENMDEIANLQQEIVTGNIQLLSQIVHLIGPVNTKVLNVPSPIHIAVAMGKTKALRGLLLFVEELITILQKECGASKCVSFIYENILCKPVKFIRRSDSKPILWTPVMLSATKSDTQCFSQLISLIAQFNQGERLDPKVDSFGKATYFTCLKSALPICAASSSLPFMQSVLSELSRNSSVQRFEDVLNTALVVAIALDLDHLIDQLLLTGAMAGKQLENDSLLWILSSDCLIHTEQKSQLVDAPVGRSPIELAIKLRSWKCLERILSSVRTDFLDSSDESYKYLQYPDNCIAFVKQELVEPKATDRMQKVYASKPWRDAIPFNIFIQLARAGLQADLSAALEAISRGFATRLRKQNLEKSRSIFEKTIMIDEPLLVERKMHGLDVKSKNDYVLDIVGDAVADLKFETMEDSNELEILNNSKQLQSIPFRRNTSQEVLPLIASSYPLVENTFSNTHEQSLEAAHFSNILSLLSNGIPAPPSVEIQRSLNSPTGQQGLLLRDYALPGSSDVIVTQDEWQNERSSVFYSPKKTLSQGYTRTNSNSIGYSIPPSRSPSKEPSVLSRSGANLMNLPVAKASVPLSRTTSKELADHQNGPLSSRQEKLSQLSESLEKTQKVLEELAQFDI